jgi:UDP:flavonoid glycosyltransferase YjiC (YdhE family)
VLIVPGGGSAHPGAENAPGVVAAAAHGIAQRGFPTILVGVPLGEEQGIPGLRPAALMPLNELAELMRSARLVICNGGDTLLQVLACGRPCIAVAIAGDQAHRIERCVECGLAASSRLNTAALVNAAVTFLDTPAPGAVTASRACPPVVNAMAMALDALGALALARTP